MTCLGGVTLAGLYEPPLDAYPFSQFIKEKKVRNSLIMIQGDLSPLDLGLIWAELDEQILSCFFSPPPLSLVCLLSGLHLRQGE